LNVVIRCYAAVTDEGVDIELTSVGGLTLSVVDQNLKHLPQAMAIGFDHECAVYLNCCSVIRGSAERARDVSPRSLVRFFTDIYSLAASHVP
jgi:hypothetical protein